MYPEEKLAMGEAKRRAFRRQLVEREVEVCPTCRGHLDDEGICPKCWRPEEPDPDEEMRPFGICDACSAVMYETYGGAVYCVNAGCVYSKEYQAGFDDIMEAIERTRYVILHNRWPLEMPAIYINEALETGDKDWLARLYCGWPKTVPEKELRVCLGTALYDEFVKFRDQVIDLVSSTILDDGLCPACHAGLDEGTCHQCEVAWV